MGMMGRKKLAAALACAAAVVGMAVGTSSAAAFTNAPVGTSVYGNLVSATFSLGAWLNCTGLASAGQVSVDNGPGAGGSISLSVISPFGCTAFSNPPTSATVTFNGLPRTLAITSGGSATIGSGTVSVAFGSLSCTYNGTITGTFNNATSQLTLGGSLSRVAGSSLCQSTSAVSGTLFLQANGNVPLQL